MASEKTIEALKTALQNEEKSVDIYQKAAERTANNVVKKTMLFLADWEKKHAEKIKQLHAHIMGELELFDVKAACNEDPMCVVKEFFGKNKQYYEDKLKGDSDDIKVYEVGMEIEKEGYDFYKQASEETDDAPAKELFEFLAKEEDIHYKFLEDQHSYVSDPESWFLDEEKWILEG